VSAREGADYLYQRQVAASSKPPFWTLTEQPSRAGRISKLVDRQQRTSDGNVSRAADISSARLDSRSQTTATEVEVDV